MLSVNVPGRNDKAEPTWRWTEDIKDTLNVKVQEAWEVAIIRKFFNWGNHYGVIKWGDTMG